MYIWNKLVNNYMLKTNKQQQQMKTKGEKISHTHPTPFCKIVPLMQAQRYTLNGMNRFARNCSPTHWRALSFSLCVCAQSVLSSRTTPPPSPSLLFVPLRLLSSLDTLFLVPTLPPIFQFLSLPSSSSRFPFKESVPLIFHPCVNPAHTRVLSSFTRKCPYDFVIIALLSPHGYNTLSFVVITWQINNLIVIHCLILIYMVRFCHLANR